MTAIGYQAALAIEDTFYYSAMVQSERLAVMGQTIATLSHHVKNILQGMRGGSYLIDAGLKRNDTDAVRRGWGIVERNQERISNLVMDMLTFSKEREPQRVDADLNETVADVVELMRARAAEMKVTIDFQPAGELPLANFDPDALHRAVLNIVTNAIDAAADQPQDQQDDAEVAEDADQLIDEAQRITAVREARAGIDLSNEPVSWADPYEHFGGQRTAGHVVVCTRFSPSEGWMVSVSDNGPGIAPGDREKIFSLFESKKGARGTGLGLPVSDKIMREHGGRIEIAAPADSRQRGTCFVLTLPVTQVGELVDEAHDTRA